MEYFNEHKIIIFRTLGSLMLVISLAAFFWTAPKKGFSENEIAAANVARMEARMAGQNGIAQKEKPKKSPFLKKYKDMQEKQMRYALIVLMITGGMFLLYSFLKKDA